MSTGRQSAVYLASVAPNPLARQHRVQLQSVPAAPIGCVARQHLARISTTGIINPVARAHTVKLSIAQGARWIVRNGALVPLVKYSDLTGPGGVVVPPPDPGSGGFIYNTTLPTEENTGVPASVNLITMTKTNGATFGTWSVDGNGIERFNPKAGAVITGYRINWPVVITTPNVVLKYCYVSGPNGISGGVNTSRAQNPEMGLIITSGTGLSFATRAKIIQCTVIPAVPFSGSTGIIGHSYLADRCKVKDVTDYFGIYNTSGTKVRADVEIIGCYGTDIGFWLNDPFHPSDQFPATHNDGVQIQGGLGIIIKGNHLHMVWSPRCDTPSTVTTKDENGRWNCDGAFGGGRAIVITSNVSPIGETDIQYNWIWSGITGPFSAWRTLQDSAGKRSYLGTYANNKDFGYHQVITSGGIKAGLGITISPELSWDTAFPIGQAVGAQQVDSTRGNLDIVSATVAGPYTSSVPSRVRVKASA